MGYEVVEKLPYLVSFISHHNTLFKQLVQMAVIKESLRVSVGLIGPLSQVVGPSSANIAGVHIPAGVSFPDQLRTFFS